MKTVYLIRHAKSSWDDSSLRDIERPLNQRGLRDAPFMAQLLKGKGASPDQIISSPANRAYTTATYFAQALSIESEDIVVRNDIYEAFPQTVLSIITSLSNDLKEVLLFGHNPLFTSLANMFSNQYIPNLPTCGIAKLTFEKEDWSLFNPDTVQLSAYHFPKQYF